MISPLAHVDPSAKIGKNVTVYPFAYIDKNVEIGDNCTIMPYASVLDGTRMGTGNTVYQSAILGAAPQGDQRADRCMHDKKSDDRRQRRHLFFLSRHANGNAHGK